MNAVFRKTILTMCVAIVVAPMAFLAVTALQIALDTTQPANALVILSITLVSGVSAIVFGAICLKTIWRRKA